MSTPVIHSSFPDDRAGRKTRIHLGMSPFATQKDVNERHHHRVV